MIKLYWKAYEVLGHVPLVEQTMSWRGTKLVSNLILVKFKSEIIGSLYTTCLKLSNEMQLYFKADVFSGKQQWLICGNEIYNLLSSLKIFETYEDGHKKLGRFNIVNSESYDNEILICCDKTIECGKVVCEL